jgi:hypothetical protein
MKLSIANLSIIQERLRPVVAAGHWLHSALVSGLAREAARSTVQFLAQCPRHVKEDAALVRSA